MIAREEQSAAAVDCGIRVPHQRGVIFICLLLFGMVVWTFLPAIHGDFVSFDDPAYVTSNPQVQSGLRWASIAWAFKSTDAVNWHPVTWLSHLVDWQLFGPRPWGHHLTSVLLHGLNAVLLFVVIRRMTGATWRSLFVAAVFALHPLRVESVAWVAERKDVLSTLFWLLSLWAYGRYVRMAEVHLDTVPGPNRFCVWSSAFRRQMAAFCPDRLKAELQTRTVLRYARKSAVSFHPLTSGNYWLALVLFALGLMSKPMLVTLPFVLLLLDYWPLKRVSGFEFRVSSWRRLVLEKWPFFVLTAASCAVTYIIQKKGGAMVGMAGLTFAARTENAAVSYCRYLGKFFWPENLSAVYPVINHWAMPAVISAVVLLVVVSVFAVTMRQRFPYFLTGWFWFVGTLVPVIGLVAVGDQSMADRYTYVPLIGPLILLAGGAHDLTRHWRHRAAIFSWAAAGVIVACTILTRENINSWKNTEALFRHAIASTKNNYKANGVLGSLLLQQGRVDEAIGPLQEVVRLRPEASLAHNSLGAALGIKGRFAEAIREFRTASRLKPGDATTRFNLGKAFQEDGQFEEAIKAYQEAVRLDPGCPICHDSLGIVLARNGRLDEAIVEFREALRLDPKDDSARRNLESAQQMKGK